MVLYCKSKSGEVLAIQSKLSDEHYATFGLNQLDVDVDEREFRIINISDIEQIDSNLDFLIRNNNDS